MTDEMKTCPFCAEEIKAEAIKCRYCGSFVNAAPGGAPEYAPYASPAAGNPLRDEWYRLSNNRMLGGVCTGLAHHFGVSVSILRVAFVLATIFSGVGILLYIVMWIILPMRRI